MEQASFQFLRSEWTGGDLQLVGAFCCLWTRAKLFPSVSSLYFGITIQMLLFFSSHTPSGGK